jgi:hypothetical protein
VLQSITAYDFLNQIENEYGSFGYDDYPRDKTHLHHIKVMLDDGGIESLYFTSDNPKNNKDYGTTDSGKSILQNKCFIIKAQYLG